LKEKAISGRKKAQLQPRWPPAETPAALGSPNRPGPTGARQTSGQVTEAEQQLASLKTCLETLEADNRSNPEPPPYVEARMDAGFVSGTT